MSTLHNVLKLAFADIDRKITAKAVERLQERSGPIERGIRNEYAAFFDYLNDALTQEKNLVPNDQLGLPDSFFAPRSERFLWKPLSEKWQDRKEKSYLTAHNDRGVFFMYHGLTKALVQGMQKRRGRKGKLKQPKIKESFKEFIEKTAEKTDLKDIERIFGPLKTTYELIRPDGGKVEMKVTKAGIQSMVQYLPKPSAGKKVPTTSLPGTRFRFTIRAFTTLKPVMTETAIVDQVSRRIRSPQWVKVVNRHHKVRALFGPLINWYLRKLFVERTRKLWENDPKRP